MGYSGIAHYPRGSIPYKGPGISLGGAGLKGRAPGCGVRDALRFEVPKIVTQRVHIHYYYGISP